ncbi:MAG: hypothetical protein GTN90_05920 [Xanthomonadales bacterium]|nr:hypothetical protein [Xanthomonadales bacterium]
MDLRDTIVLRFDQLKAFGWPAVVLAGLVLLDFLVLIFCPLLGGDCLYGFFSLIVFPVILTGPVGLAVPRNAARLAQMARALAEQRLGGAAGERLAWFAGTVYGEVAVWLAGALALALLITIAHVLAIFVFNAFDYGGALIRPRLLQVELGLAAIYYVGLGAIAYALRPARHQES